MRLATAGLSGLARALAGTRLLVLVIVALSILPSEVGSQQTTGAAVSGVVVDGTTGRPIAGAVVSLYAPLDQVATRQAASQVTDAEGRFVFSDVAPTASLEGGLRPGVCACYSLNATKPGYLGGGYGSSSVIVPRTSFIVEGFRNISLAEGQWLRDARVVLWHAGSISGQVRDERGEAVVGVYVRAMTRLFVGGQSRLTAGPIARTDDRGQYRLPDLPSGDYVVMVPSTLLRSPGPSRRVGSPENRAEAYPLVFSPAARSATDATVITLGLAEERQGVDVQLQPVPTRRISGKLEGNSFGLFLRLMPAGNEALGIGSEFAKASPDKDGAFAFENVPDGDYTIRATSFIAELVYPPTPTTAQPIVPWVMRDFSLFGKYSSRASGQAGDGQPELWRGAGATDSAYWGEARVTLEGRDADKVLVSLRRAVTLSGTIQTEGQGFSMSVAGRGAPFTLEPSGGNASLGLPRSYNVPDPARCPAVGRPAVTPQGLVQQASATCSDFRFEGLLGGEYFLGPSSTFVVKSAMWNGQDYADLPFDGSSGVDITGVRITLTTNVATISGSIRDDKGAPVANAVVMFFSTNRQLWGRFGMGSQRMGSILATNNGTYQIPTLPAGEFYLVVVSESQRGAWQNPEFLAAASNVATTVTAGWGEKKTVDLVVREVK